MISRRRVVLGAAAGLVPAALSAQQIVKPRPPVGAADPDIARWVAQVSRGRLHATVAGLSAFPTRWTPGAGFPAVEDWVARAFADTGAGPVTRQAYAMPSGVIRHNIVGGAPRPGRQIVLVGAHFDSISGRPDHFAPGASDNATGVAAMLEVRRILPGVALARDPVFIGFSGEEQSLVGSRFAAGVARAEGWPIAAMVNLDMLGWRPPDPATPMVVEYDMGNAVPGNDAAARRYGGMAAQMMAAHTSLSVTHADIWSSDYMPFERAGVPCIGFFDGGTEGAGYHTAGDVIEAVDFDRLEQVTRGVVATVARIANYGKDLP